MKLLLTLVALTLAACANAPNENKPKQKQECAGFLMRTVEKTLVCITSESK